MAECPTAIILSAILLSSGFTLFTRPIQKAHDSGGCNCTTLSSVIFLTAVFAWLSGRNINVFRCKLPDRALFFYEFFLSLFLFEMALRLFWEPIECYISSALPAWFEENVLHGECVLFGIYCPGDSLFFTVLVYITAVGILWSVLYGYGIISDSL